MDFVLGIDVGTGGSRVVIVGADGRVLASATAEHMPFTSPRTAWAEQDPEDWWRACRQAIREALTTGDTRPSSIRAVGLSGQMHGAVLLDEAGAVVRPAIIWCDQRTEAECRWLADTLGPSRLLELTSNPALTNFTLPKLLWVRAHEPDAWKRVRRVLLPKDFVRLRLSGEYAIDMADASGTLMLDVAHRRWSQEIIEAAGLDTSMLPRLFESPEICAHVSARGCSRNEARRRRHADRRRRGRPGSRRGGNGNHSTRRGQRHDRHVRRGVCGDRSTCARSGRTPSHVLSCHPRSLARDGRHAGSGPVAALAARAARFEGAGRCGLRIR